MRLVIVPIVALALTFVVTGCSATAGDVPGASSPAFTASAGTPTTSAAPPESTLGSTSLATIDPATIASVAEAELWADGLTGQESREELVTGLQSITDVIGRLEAFDPVDPTIPADLAAVQADVESGAVSASDAGPLVRDITSRLSAAAGLP